VVGTQFWYPQEGGVYLLWYLPLVLMVTFRPRLVHLTPPGQLDQEAELTSRVSTLSTPSFRGTGLAVHRAHAFR
jgi:hypothetical protein